MKFLNQITKFHYTWGLFIIFCLLSACNGESTPSDGTDGSTVEPYEASFVVKKLEIGTIDQGFDLDGVNTQCSDGSCIPDGQNGVDNRLSEILKAIDNATTEDFDANASIAENIQKGDMLIVLRVLDINTPQMGSLTGSDSHVEVKGYMGVDTDDPENPDDNFSGTEPMDIDSRSLQNSSDPESSLIHFGDCNISAGKLKCNPSLFKLDITIQDNTLSLDVEKTQLVATIDQSPSKDGNSGAYLGGSLKNGVLGGYVPIKNLQNALNQFADQLQGIDPGTIQNILVEHADIDATPPGPTDVPCTGNGDCLPWQDCRQNFCFEPADQPDAISLAVVFEAVSVQFTGNIVTPQ